MSGRADLLDMLASETDRRCGAIVEGVEELTRSERADSKRVEALRVEAHGLKGAALVVGQDRLADLAREIELSFAECQPKGKISVPLSAKLIAATSALHEGAQAVAEGLDEPTAVANSLAALKRA
jgi:HPt (histidine-containing phosphotransfer) domain-containing protein